MKLCMGCMNEMEDHLTTCPHCGFNESALRQESYYLDPGTIIGGKYIVGRVLSYGGHTVSYLGMDAEAERKVIVKEYLPSDFSTRSEGETEVTIYSGDAQEQFKRGLTNFLNEANKIQALGTPEGIARVYNCIAENDTGYVISEYIKGKTLKDILASGKKYSVNETVSFISKILKGLSKVHPMNIIHCDISPETIMVTDSGEIKLLDFGATRYVTTANSKSLAIILKQGYAPEEQYRSSGKRGPWTDVYALGAVMYRMITGIVPQESVERALVDELKEPSKLGITIPVNVENALMNALNVYQEERTPSAEVFLRELKSDSVKRIKVAKRKNEVGKFPTWAKGLVAALLCIVVMGGVYIVRHGGSGNRSSEQTSNIMPGLVDKSEKDAEEELKVYGYAFEVKKIYTYTDDDSLSGKVVKQSVAPGELKSGDDVTIDDKGNVTGKLTLTIASTDYISLENIRDWGRNALKLDDKIDAITENQLRELEDEKGSGYGVIKKISLKDGSIWTENDLKERDGSIKISDIPNEGIQYYAKNFFYWDSFPDYEMKYIAKDNNNASDFGSKNLDEDGYEIFNRPLYKLEDGKPVKEDNERGDLREDPSMVDSNYASFDRNALYIFKQNVDDGIEVSSGQTLETDNDEAVLLVIGERITYSDGTTGEEIKNKLINEYGVKEDNISYGGSGDGSHNVDMNVGISISFKSDVKEEDRYQLDYKDSTGGFKVFKISYENNHPKIDDNIQFVINTEKPIPATTQATQTQQSRGGNSGDNFDFPQ